MLLHYALQQSECPICLQPLNFTLCPSPSRPASPLSTTTYHTTNAPSSVVASTNSGSVDGSLTLSRTNSGSGVPGDEREFRITFAPDVYGSDAADPWHLSFERPTRDPATNAPADPLLPSPVSSSTNHITAQSGQADGSDPSPHGGTDESACGVAVLPCGHLLHTLCAMQLCEYAPHPSCPICRLRLTSVADLVAFHPRVRAPPRGAETAVAVVAGDRVDAARTRAVVSSGTASATTPPRGRGDEGSNSVTVVADESEPQSALSDRAVTASSVDTLSNTNARANSAARLPNTASLCSSSSAAPLCTTERDVPVTLDPSSSQEDDIQILGARQLPPAQAYADLLLRSTATWSDRADVLATRVAHLEKSQQQLQRDCTELEAALASARRRREVLLNLPPRASSQQHGVELTDASFSFDRLRDLRRLCEDTRTAMTEATAQLAASTREGAEVRRQMDKYTRKLNRIEAGERVEEPGEKRPKRESVTPALHHA